MIVGHSCNVHLAGSRYPVGCAVDQTAPAAKSAKKEAGKPGSLETESVLSTEKVTPIDAAKRTVTLESVARH